jgi:ribonuclease R
VRFRDIAGEDFYVFNPDQGLAFGKRSGRTFRRGDKVLVRLLRVDPLRGQADFSILEKLSSEPKKRRRQGEFRDSYRDVHERADRAAAAEALGYVSQPDDDDFGFDEDAPSFIRNGRSSRRESSRKEKPRKTISDKSSKAKGPKAYGEKLSRGRGGRGRSGRR